MKSSIKEVILKRNRLGDDCIDGLGSFIQDSNWIEKLDLSYNNIEDKGINLLTNYLENNTRMSSLDLQGNLGITDYSASAIRKAITQSCISKIYLNNTCINNQIKLELDKLSKTILPKRTMHFEDMTQASTKRFDQVFSEYNSPILDRQREDNSSAIKSGIDLCQANVDASSFSLNVEKILQKYEQKVINAQKQMENNTSESISDKMAVFLQLYLKKEEIETKMKQKLEKNGMEERKGIEIERDSIKISVMNYYSQLKVMSNNFSDCIHDKGFDEFVNLESQIILAEELVNKLKNLYDESKYTSFQCPPSSLLDFDGYQNESINEEVSNAEPNNQNFLIRKLNEIEALVNLMVNKTYDHVLNWSKKMLRMKEKFQLLSKSKKELEIKIVEIEKNLERYGEAIEHQNESMIKLKEIEDLEKVIDKKDEEINYLELSIKEMDIDITRRKRDLSKTEKKILEKELAEMQKKMNECRWENEDLLEELNEKCKDKNGNCIFPDRIRSTTGTQINLFPLPDILKIKSKRCELMEKIGGGAFSSVFKAKVYKNGRCREDNPVVAFKQYYILPNSIKDEELKMIEREIEMLGHLEHPNIVKINGVIGDSNAKDMNEKLMGIGFVMEYCENGSLRLLLDKNSSHQHQQLMNMDLIIHLLFGAAQGLEYLHNHEPSIIIHGDIKSDNILIDKEYNAKLCDFGISKLQQTTMASTKGGGNIGGTLVYKAPEAFNGKVDTKSDVYSFGCVILEILTGERPWNELGNNPMRIMQKVLFAKELHDLSKIRTNAKEELVNLMKKCLDYDKDKRPTMEEVIMELEMMINNAVLIGLDIGTDEYNKVENLFFPGGDKEGSLKRNSYRIVNIEKIWHGFAERRYQTELAITQSRMTKIIPPLSISSRSLSSFSSITSSISTTSLISTYQGQKEYANERLLFHGTSQTDPIEILKHPDAFMKDYADSNGYYGRGLYFADLARYSNGYRLDDKGNKSYYRYKIRGTKHYQLLLCSVICGESVDYGVSVTKDTRALSQKDFEGKFESIRAGPHQPTESGPGEDDSYIYVVYKDTQVAPRYLITYESIKVEANESEVDDEQDEVQNEIDNEEDDENDNDNASSYSEEEDDVNQSQGESDGDDISI